MPGFPSPITINVTGCGNGCAHHHVSDIGLEGRKIKVDGESRNAFTFRLGGALGQNSTLSRAVGYQCTAEDLPDALGRLLHDYLQERTENESVRDYLSRNSNEALRAILAGQTRTA